MTFKCSHDISYLKLSNSNWCVWYGQLPWIHLSLVYSLQNKQHLKAHPQQIIPTPKQSKVFTTIVYVLTCNLVGLGFCICMIRSWYDPPHRSTYCILEPNTWCPSQSKHYTMNLWAAVQDMGSLLTLLYHLRATCVPVGPCSVKSVSVCVYFYCVILAIVFRKPSSVFTGS